VKIVLVTILSGYMLFHQFSMANNSQRFKEWSILCHNIRGINSSDKWNSIRNNIRETACDIICIQETKRASFDENYLRNFSPRQFDQFVFYPSIGASGGTLTCWIGSKFTGQVLFQNEYAQVILFKSKLTNHTWSLLNIYAPCTHDGRIEFLQWFSNLDIDPDHPWLILGDFNLIRRPENRNKPGGNTHLMQLFNEAISELGLEEIPLSVQIYTWSNKQQNPLLEKLDWCFVSQD
jgi:exonuclease III